MKSILQITATIFLQLLILTSCQKKIVKVKIQPKKLMVLAYDISKSNDDYAILQKFHIDGIVKSISANGGGVLATLFIQSNSMNQEVEVYIIPIKPELEKVPLNRFTKDSVIARNNRNKENYKKTIKELIENISKTIIQPKDEPYTDLQYALRLVSNLVNNSKYKNYKKQIVLISDLVNDQKGGQINYDTMPEAFLNKLDFKDSKIICVRPNMNIVTPSDFFRKNEVIKFDNIKQLYN